MNKQRGVTLTELMLAMAIIGIVATGMVSALLSTSKLNEATALTNSADNILREKAAEILAQAKSEEYMPPSPYNINDMNYSGPWSNLDAVIAKYGRQDLIQQFDTYGDVHVGRYAVEDIDPERVRNDAALVALGAPAEGDGAPVFMINLYLNEALIPAEAGGDETSPSADRLTTSPVFFGPMDLDGSHGEVNNLATPLDDTRFGPNLLPVEVVLTWVPEGKEEADRITHKEIVLIARTGE